MSIALLTEVYDETRRLAIAGSDLAGGDFRLKRLVAPLEKAAAQAPVFGKVAEAIQKLIDSPPQQSAGALLELSTLVCAILYTQGETGAEGNLEPLETSDLGLPASTASARVLKPLIEALTSTGSGRLEIIVDAHRRGAFRDLRLVRPALKAIDDGYAEIGDFVADNVLPLYGKAIYGDLQSSYDPKGKGGHVRRLRLMHRLAPEATRELVTQALESGSKEMKIGALECLEGSAEALPYLLEQAKAKSTEIREVALRAIAGLTDEHVVDTLIAALSGADLELAARPASQNRSPKLLAFLLQEAEKQLIALLATKAKAAAKDKAGDKKLPARFYHLLSCFASRDDKQTIAFLTRCFERRDEIGKLKGEYSGQQINRRIARLLVRTGSKPAQKRVIDAHQTLAPEVLDVAIVAALLCRKPAEVYNLFSPYYLAHTGGKKKDPAALKREAVRQLLSHVSSFRQPTGYYGSYVDFDDDIAALGKAVQEAKLDPRWLDAAVQTKDLEIVQALARPAHAGACEFLATTLEERLKKKGDFDYRVSDVLEAMIRAEHPNVIDHYLAVVQKAANDRWFYSGYWLARLIPDLPADAAPRIEALLPSLPEKLVDQIAPYLTELKARGAGT
jgi:hypothetical protein